MLSSFRKKSFVPLGLGLLSGLVLSSVGKVQAAEIVFENDLVGWEAAVGGNSTLIDFEDIVISSDNNVALSGNEFEGSPNSPTFSAVEGGLYVGKPGEPGTAINNFFEPDYVPVSGTQVFSPGIIGSPSGITRISFADPITAFSTIFLDVETDFAATGFDLNLDGIIDVAFSAFQGDDSQSFLGFLSDTPLSVLDVHFSSASGDVDGIGMDDARYASTADVPEPMLNLALGVSAAAGLGLAKRRQMA